VSHAAIYLGQAFDTLSLTDLGNDACAAVEQIPTLQTFDSSDPNSSSQCRCRLSRLTFRSACVGLNLNLWRSSLRHSHWKCLKEKISPRPCLPDTGIE